MKVEGQTNDLCEWDELLSNPQFDPNALGERGKNLLHWAISSGDEQKVKFLVKNPKVNINRPDASGCYPILQAVGTGQIKITKIILNGRGIDPNLSDADGKTAFKIAMFSDSSSIFSILTKSVRVEIDISVEDLLRLDNEKFTIISKRASDLIGRDEEGNTILHRLVPKANTTGRMRQLLENYFALDLQNLKGETALHLACKNGIEDGARSHEPLLSDYVTVGCNLEKIKLLVDQGASLDIQESSGLTPLAIAIRHDNMDAAKYLVSEGANMDVVEMPEHIRAELSKSN